jgi:FkbM family methyltransferase
MMDTRSLKIDVSPDDVVIDCGANVGLVTQYFQRQGAIVYAFEPNAYAFQALLRNFRNYPNVKCLPVGVSSPSQAGSGRLFLHEHATYDQLTYSTGCSINPDKNNVDVNNYLEIELIDLCEFIKFLNTPVKVLKIDIEGAEIELLNALIDQGLTERIEYIFAETHERKIPSLRGPLELLKEKIKEKNITNIDLTWR